MSWCSRRLLLLGGAALAGCGFTPAYGPGGAAHRLQNAILVEAPEGRAGYLLQREIEDRLGRGQPGRFGLSYAIDLERKPIAISARNVTTRYDLLGTVTYALRNKADGAVVISGKAESFTSYSASGSTVATQAAERDAEARLMKILADQLTARLVAEAGRLPG
jgi:LPS-assembly lipoprotein